MILPLKNSSKVALISSKDYLLVRGYPWRLNSQVRDGYTTYYVTAWNGKTNIYLHRLLTNAPKGMQVDHINGDGLDNRQQNLRVVTASENQKNRRHGRWHMGGVIGSY